MSEREHETPASDSEAEPKSLDEKVSQLVETNRMIGNVRDDERLLEARENIREILPKIDSRIEEIKNEGKSISDVPTQKRLFAEYESLDSSRVVLKNKLKAVDAKLFELSDKQKAFFGLE